MNRKILVALLVLSLTTIFCTYLPGEQSNPTPDVNALVNATLTAMAATSMPIEPTSTVETALPTIAATGSISGHLSYPSESIPPLRVVAFDALNVLNYSYVDTILNQSEFTISDLPAGSYHVVAYLIGSDSLAGGYSQMVPCGLAYGCNDHSLIDVVVTSGQTTTDIDPGDWYAEPGSFPPMPNP